MNRTNRFLLSAAAFLLMGCVTQRTASYPGRDYDAVFKGAVAGLCQEEGLIVYGADRANGVISVQGRGLMVGPPDAQVRIAGASGGTPTATVWPLVAQDFYLEIISRSLPPGQPAPTPASIDLEKQKLDLDRQKLELEKEKLELEKQKLQQQQQQPPAQTP